MKSYEIPLNHHESTIEITIEITIYRCTSCRISGIPRLVSALEISRVPGCQDGFYQSICAASSSLWPKPGIIGELSQYIWKFTIFLKWFFPLNMVIFHSYVNLYQRVLADYNPYIYLIGGLERWNFMTFPFSWEFHHHWRSPSFFRG